MNEKLKNSLMAVLIIIILMIPIIINYINSMKVEIKTFNDFYSNISSTDFSLVYFGTTEKEDYKPYKENLIAMRKEYSIEVYTVDTTNLTNNDKERLANISDEFRNENVYTIVRDGEVIYTTSNRLIVDDLRVLINKWNNNIIPDDDVSYKTVSTYKEYMAIANSKNTTMAVFGRNSCHWCNRFKPIYNDVAAEYNLDIYYFDSDSFNSQEYSKILSSGLTIPAKCSSTKTEQPLSAGFATPLTLFTQNGKTIDCISGYVNKTRLVSVLKETGIIKDSVKEEATETPKPTTKKASKKK